MDVRELPFDQYQRYRLVGDLLDSLRPNPGTRFAILDVGGRTALLRHFLGADDVTLVDVERSDERGLVLGSGAALPFADDAFDVVCAFDTLEHVPPDLRTPFVRECHRVARRWVLIAGPFASPRVDEAEELLARFLREKLGIRHRYLEEHRANGLPDRVAVAAELERLGSRTTAIGHGQIDRWLALMAVAMYMDDDPALRALLRDVNRFYNETLYASDHAEPVYRHVVCAALGDARLPSADEVLEPVAAGPTAGHTLSELGFELMAFDSERKAWRAERETYRQAIAELETDLAEHAKTVGAQRTELAGLREQAADQRARLERDLNEHKRVLDAAKVHSTALEDSLAEVREDRDRSRAAVETMAADLDQHRRVLAELRTELEAVLADREAVRSDAEQQRASVLADRDAHRERAEALEGERVRLQHELAAASGDLAALREELVRVHEALHGRFANLKRALAPRHSRPAPPDDPGPV